MRRSLAFVLVATAVAALSPALHAADVVRPGVLVPQAARAALAVRNPQGTAFAMAALLRFANGVPAATPLEQSLHVALSRTPNALATAKRLVARYERLSAAERLVHLPGVADGGNLQTRSLELGTFRQVSAATLQATVGGITLAPSVELTPEPADLAHAAEISFAGLTCATPATAAGVSPGKVATFAMLVNRQLGAYNVAATSLLPLPSAALAAGASSAAGASPVYSAPDFNVGVMDAGPLFLSAVLADDGDLPAQQADITLLVNLAQAFAANVPGDDRMTALKTGVDYTAGVLHLSNPDRWSVDAIATRIIGKVDYAKMLATAPVTANGITSKLSTHHDPKGGSYTAFFTSPTTALLQRPVTVTLLHVTATGTLKDSENGLADFTVKVTIDGEVAQRDLAKDKNDVAMSFSVLRKVSGPAAKIVVEVLERDPAPTSSGGYGGFGGLGGGVCSYCGDAPSPQFSGLCSYTGPCPVVYEPVDVSGPGGVRPGPHPTSVSLSIDPVSGAITGDLNGKRGDVFVTHGGGRSTRRADLTFRVD